MNPDTNFLNIINEQYPFERYIVKNPKTINFIFDDALLTELFVPETEIKVITDESGTFCTQINPDEIYIKIKGPSGEMRFAYYDFNDHIREEIRDIIIQDFGHYEWQCLYVESEDESDLKEALLIQQTLIIDKYGECNLKERFKNTDIENLLK